MMIAAKRLLLLCIAFLALPAVAAAQTIAVSPGEGPAGQSVTVSGSGWQADATAGVAIFMPAPPDTVGNSEVEVARADPDANGDFSVSFNIPTYLTEGVQPIIGAGQNETINTHAETSFTVTASQSQQLPPAITGLDSFQEGDLVFFRASFTDPNDDAEGFGFRWAPGEESHPFSDPSFGRVSPGQIAYPFNLTCSTNPFEIDVEVWIYDSTGLRSPSKTIHLACSNASQPDVWREPGGRADNLVVFVHGCCTSPDDLPDWDKHAAALRDDLESRGVMSSWELVVLDWTDSTPKLALDPFDVAYTAALQRGMALAGAIAQHSYEYVHLIGHSAGARLIDEAARCLSMMKSNQKYHTILHAVADPADRKALHDSCKPPSGGFNTPFIHLTFLDAFTQTRCVNPSCSSKTDDKNTYGNATGFDTSGKRTGFAEHYVDTSGPPGTDANLKHAFNFDITNWLKSQDDADCINTFSGGGLVFPGHQWPRCWYANSIEFLGSGGLYGYTLSREAGNDAFAQLRCRLPQGKKCSLSDPLAKCGKDAHPNVHC